RNAATVSQVGKLPQTESENRTLAVKDRHRRDLLPANTERTGDAKQVNLRKSSATRCVRIEYVKERSPQVVQRRFVAEAGHRPLLQHVEAADVVEPHDVVGVSVGEDDGVHPAQTERQRLWANVRPGI